MRVTTFGVNAQYLNDLNNVMQKYQNYEQQLTTGRQLNQPSDNPVAFEADIATQTQITEVTQWQGNVSSALSQAQNTDSSLQTLENNLGQIRTNLLGAVNGTHTQSDIQNILAVVKQQTAELARIGNTSDGQQYIFAGTNGKQLPITVLASGSLVWNLTGTPSQQLTIGQNVSISLGTSGQQLFSTSPAVGVPDLITTVNSIITDMNSAATAATPAAFSAAITSVQTDLSKLDSNIDNVTALRADLGGRMSRMQSVQTQMQQLSTTLTEQKGKSEDADMAQVMSQLSTQQTVYQAALLSGQHLILPTLTDVLK